MIYYKVSFNYYNGSCVALYPNYFVCGMTIGEIVERIKKEYSGLMGFTKIIEITEEEYSEYRLKQSEIEFWNSFVQNKNFIA